MPQHHQTTHGSRSPMMNLKATPTIAPSMNHNALFQTHKYCKPKPQYPKNVQINIDCDHIASETTEIVAKSGVPADLPPLLQPPYPGSRAMLKIGKRWITSNFKRHLYDARRTPPVRIYLKEKYDWTDNIFDSIDWAAIGRCRRKLPLQRKRQTCKIMHGWLPTMTKNFTTTTTQCPGCSCRRETTDHMIICSNARMKKKQEEIITALRKKGLGGRTPRAISNAVCDIVESYFLETERLSLNPNGRARTIRDRTTSVHPRFHHEQMAPCVEGHRRLATRTGHQTPSSLSLG